MINESNFKFDNTVVVYVVVYVYMWMGSNLYQWDTAELTNVVLSDLYQLIENCPCYLCLETNTKIDW